MSSLFFYIALFLLVTCIVLFGKRKLQIGKFKINISLLIACTILTIASAIRYNVGTDYKNYIDMYKVFEFSNFQNIFDWIYQLGFNLVLLLSKFVFHSPNALFAISSIISGIFLYKILNKVDNQRISAIVIMMYSFIIYPMSLNFVRQGIAILIGIYALMFFNEKKYKKFIIYSLLAFSFHPTALLLFPVGIMIYFVKKKNFKKRTIACFILSIIVICLSPWIIEFILKIDFFSHFKMYDFNEDLDLASCVKTFLIRLPIYVIIFTNRKELLKNDDNKMWIIMIFFEMLFIFAKSVSFYLHRIMFYFSFAEFILVAIVSKNMESRKYKLYVLLLLAYCIIFFTWSFYILGQSNVIPYQTIF